MIGVVAAVAAGLGVLLVAIPGRDRTLTERIGWYLTPRKEPDLDTASSEHAPASSVERAGLPWSTTETALRRAAAGGVGALVGLLLAQGDLFTGAVDRSAPGLAVLGAAGGFLVFSMRMTTRRERRARRLALELPVIADGIGLRVIAGDSIPVALADLVAEGTGVAVDELTWVIDRYHEGSGLAEALNGAAGRTVEPAASRLYTLLGQVHLTGGRLAEALAELAADYRAALTRELVSEQGRRALATYGPILALMVPVTLLFLMFPTLVGLRDLAASP